MTTHWGTLTVLEFLWIVFGAFGLYFNLAALRKIRQYYTAIRAMNGNRLVGLSDMMRILGGHRRNEFLRMAGSLMVIIIGVAAATQPSANPNKPISFLASIITIGLFVIVTKDIVGSVMDHRQRLFLERKTGSR